MKKILKEKKADIPITILVLGVLIICVLAIVSFVISKNKNEKNLLGVEVIEAVNSDAEKFYFYRNLGFSNEEAAEKINATIEGNYLIIRRDGFRPTKGLEIKKFDIEKKTEKFISIEYKVKLD